MDCYFRQYWRDNRLSFKGLKQTANNVIINQVLKTWMIADTKWFEKSTVPVSHNWWNYHQSDGKHGQWPNPVTIALIPKWNLNSSPFHDFHHHQLSLNVKMLEKIWKPDTYFHNGLDSYLHTITRLRIWSNYNDVQFTGMFLSRPNKLLRISEHGDITYSIRLTIKAKYSKICKIC